MKLLFSILLIYSCLIMGQNKKNGETKNQTTAKKDSSTVWIAPKSADKVKNPLAGIIEATHKGENLFVQNCTECHGMTGRGDGPTADMLDTKPANLSSAKVQRESDGALFWKISEGKGAMASYKNVFSGDQIWQLVNYIRTLGKDHSKQKK